MEKERNKSCGDVIMVESQKKRAQSWQPFSENIPIEEVVALFRCCSCEQAPMPPPIFSCFKGHLTCSLCYKRGSKAVCKVCGEAVVGRNLVLDEAIRGLCVDTVEALKQCRKPLRTSRSEQSLTMRLLDPSHVDKCERARKASKAGDSVQNSDSLASLLAVKELNHGPVMCPYPCGRIFTCSGIFPHFEFHHPRVYVETVRKDQPCELLLGAEWMGLGTGDVDSRCVAVLVVRLDDTEDEEDDRWSAAELLKVTRSGREMLRNACFISTVTMGRLNGGSGPQEGLFTAWASSLYELSTVTCSLSAYNETTSHCVSFTGPLVPLHDSQRPGDVFARGDCLLIPPGLMQESQVLRLTATFHSDVELFRTLLPIKDIPPVQRNPVND